MSDDFDDDSFFADDSFLREVDHITAQASTSTVPPRPQPAGRQPLSNASAGPSRRPAARPSLGIRRAPPPPASSTTRAQPALFYPSSDDYPDISLEEDSLAAIDALTANSTETTLPAPRQPPTFQPGRIGSSFSRIPSSNLTRSSSGKCEGFLQTHLNFRKENQATRGKRWDRMMFAESGRRIGVKEKQAKGTKGKGKGKGRAYDSEEEEDEEEDDWGEPLAPNPKPLVDISQPYGPQRHEANPATIGTYIYPTNRSRRDYQFEIVRACFADNCLVALPTGLGKTFVAGVVMLNFYRWFPTGKIVFLAPTRPLVNQQIEACQLACGIPSAAAAVMTGQSVSAKERTKLWDERRVFYCTPQTLDNDLKKGSVDPRDIVLAVFDEAHKASGSYAYTTILAYITAHHPFFRVLALTATPGADVPKVQAVVDALHISRIEIREAEAPDIRKYMNEKHTEKHFVKMSVVICGFRDRWAALMKPYIAKLVQKDILNDRDLDAAKLRTFRLTALRMDIARDRNSSNKWCLGSLSTIEKMTRAMGHLLEFSLGMFHTGLLEIAGQTKTSGKQGNSKASAGSIRSNFEFQKLLRDVEEEMNDMRAGRMGKTNADRHPKMQKTLELLLAHFAQAAEDEEVHGIKNDTRAMVFCSYRECVLEIVDMLNQHPVLLKATKFVGQSQGKQEGDKGFNQKEQKKTINEFKEGKFNILVATSIGEEGLDIGEVDFVVIYDMPKQSIKLLQRIGRTGRKRDGHVHVLMSEGREDYNWDKAQTTHREIQEEILHSRNLELFEDVEPLIPRSQFPTCVEQEMPVDPWDPEDQKMKRKLPSAEQEQGRIAKQAKQAKPTTAAKGTVQRGHQVPEGAEGFKSVSALLKESGKVKVLKRARGGVSDDDEGKMEGSDGEDGGGAKGRKKKAAKRGPVRKDRSDNDDDEDVGRNARGGSGSEARTAKADVDEEEAEEEDVLDFLLARNFSKALGSMKPPKVARARGVVGEPARGKSKTLDGKPFKSKSTVPSSASALQTQPPMAARPEPARPAREREQGTIDFLSMSGTAPKRRALTPLATPPSSPPDYVPKATAMPLSSPPPEPVENRTSLSEAEDYVPVGGEKGGGHRLSPRLAAVVGFSQIGDFNWDDDDDVELLDTPEAQRHAARITNGDDEGHDHRPPPLGHSKSVDAMPPPPVPMSARTSSPLVPKQSPGYPATQFPVRRPGQRTIAAARRVIETPSSAGSEGRRDESNGYSVDQSPIVQLNRLRRRVETESPDGIQPQAQVQALARRRDNGRERSRRAPAARVRQFLDVDAEVSDPEFASSDEASSDIETESDRRFAANFQPTQAPAGYDQHAMYVAGLSTQAAPRAGLSFRGDAEARREVFMAKARRPVYITDDEDEEDGGGLGGVAGRGGRARAREESSENEYELGSFVVDDDDVVFATQSDPHGSGW